MSMERSSPARTAGTLSREIVLHGEKYLLSHPERTGIFAEQEEVILSRRLDPIAFAIRACSRTPASRHAAIWEGCSAAASRGIASAEEWAAFEDNLWKPAYMFWRTLDPQSRPDLPLVRGVAWALDIIHGLNKDDFDELLSAIAFVSQDADVKNSSGPSDNSGTRRTENHSSTGGQQYSPTSPNASAGPGTT